MARKARSIAQQRAYYKRLRLKVESLFGSMVPGSIVAELSRNANRELAVLEEMEGKDGGDILTEMGLL